MSILIHRQNQNTINLEDDDDESETYSAETEAGKYSFMEEAVVQ